MNIRIEMEYMVEDYDRNPSENINPHENHSNHSNFFLTPYCSIQVSHQDGNDQTNGDGHEISVYPHKSWKNYMVIDLGKLGKKTSLNTQSVILKITRLTGNNFSVKFHVNEGHNATTAEKNVTFKKCGRLDFMKEGCSLHVTLKLTFGATGNFTIHEDGVLGYSERYKFHVPADPF